MTYAVSRHDIHTFVHGLARGHENHWARHDLFDQGRSRRSSLEDDLSGVIALGDDAGKLAVRNHDQRPNRLVGHSFNGFVDGLIWRDKPDFAPFVFQNRANRATHFGHRLTTPIRTLASVSNLSSAIISLAETEVKLSLHFPMDVLGIVAWIRFAELRGIKSFAYGGPGRALIVVVFLRPPPPIISA